MSDDRKQSSPIAVLSDEQKEFFISLFQNPRKTVIDDEKVRMMYLAGVAVGRRIDIIEEKFQEKKEEAKKEDEDNVFYQGMDEIVRQMCFGGQEITEDHYKSLMKKFKKIGYIHSTRHDGFYSEQLLYVQFGLPGSLDSQYRIQASLKVLEQAKVELAKEIKEYIQNKDDKLYKKYFSKDESLGFKNILIAFNSDPEEFKPYEDVFTVYNLINSMSENLKKTDKKSEDILEDFHKALQANSETIKKNRDSANSKWRKAIINLISALVDLGISSAKNLLPKTKGEVLTEKLDEIKNKKSSGFWK